MIRLMDQDRPAVVFQLDGRSVEAREGDTVLTAVLSLGGALRQSEFGDGARAGFCLMGACQDCWMWTRDGERLRGCSTPVSSDLDLITSIPSEAVWPNRE